MTSLITALLSENRSMISNLSDIRHSRAVIFTVLLFLSLSSRNVFSQPAPADTLYNQSHDWVPGYRETLPEWVFASGRHGCVIGVSDPGMKPEAARQQALQRAAYLYSLQESAHIDLLSDIFSATETATNTYEDERNKMLTLGMIAQPIRQDSYRIEKEHTSVYGEKFILVSFIQADSCTLSYQSVSELMFLFTKEKVEEEEIKFELQLESVGCQKQLFQSGFHMKGAWASPQTTSYMNGIRICPSHREYWYEDTSRSENREDVNPANLKSGFWNAYMASLVKALLLHQFSSMSVRQVSDRFDGDNNSGRALYREKITAVLSVSPFVKAIQNNRLCVDWLITEQPNVKER